MSKPYKKLRAKLMEYDIDQIYLAGMLDKGLTYVNQRMVGKRPWSQEDMYTLMDELNIPYNEMHIYFPNHGKSVRLAQVGFREGDDARKMYCEAMHRKGR